MNYYHSVTLDKDKCQGCTNCIKRCPTEAIRVRDGKAWIIEERCIDCGECIRICPNDAKVAITDDLGVVRQYRHAIALPAPSFFGQFGADISGERILAGIAALGFHKVYEVAVAAEIVSYAFQQLIANPAHVRPLISSACPAVVRLMQVRFPSLIDHITPVESPMEVAAARAKIQVLATGEFAEHEVGAFFITPCPAKVTAVKQPEGTEVNHVDGAIGMNFLYGEVLKNLDSPHRVPRLATGRGLGWGRSGGEAMAVGQGVLLAVDGIHNVIAVLEEVEQGRLDDIDFIEAQACVGGCVGGPLVVQNPFVARVRIRNIAEQMWQETSSLDWQDIVREFRGGRYQVKGAIRARPVMRLDEDVDRAIAKVKLVEEILAVLPGLDCGSCGSPNCRALAEDIAREDAAETDCVFKLRERVQELAKEVLALAQKMPPAMGKKGGGTQ